MSVHVHCGVRSHNNALFAVIRLGMRVSTLCAVQFGTWGLRKDGDEGGEVGRELDAAGCDERED